MNAPIARADISVIIPVLNDAEPLERLLTQLTQQTDVNLQLIVADGGSDDRWCEVAERFGATIVETERGRAVQMNAGRRVATSDTLLFLHADSELTDPALLRVALNAYTTAVIRAPGPVAGHFSLRFQTARVAGEKTPFAYRYLEGKTRLNRRNTQNGDQGYLVRADFFDRIGPFDERMGFLEDQRFAESLRAVGEWITLPGTLRTSARRVEKEGFSQRYLVMSITMGMFDAGLDTYFDVAPTVYPTQADTDELDVLPYLGAIVKTMRVLGPISSVVGWYKVGSFIRRNSWQIFYFVDTVFDRETEQGPCLKFHDRIVEPLIDHPIGNAATTVGAFYFFMGICPAWFTAKRFTAKRRFG